MRVWVLGIATVLCFHVGFSAYIAMDRASDTRLLEPVLVPIPELAAATWDQEPALFAKVGVSAHGTGTAEPSGRETRRPQGGKEARYARQNPSRLVAKKVQRSPKAPTPSSETYAVFKPVIIPIRAHFPDGPVRTEYPIKPAEQNSAMVRQLSAEYKPRSEKRTSGAFAVLKKPVVWIKAFGSKIF